MQAKNHNFEVLTRKTISAYDGVNNMKKLAAAVLAAEPIRIEKPSGLGFSNVGTFITSLLTLAFAVAIFVVLVMLIWGAFEWITSGGDKDHVASARNRIINALIGLAVLAVAFAVAKVGADFVGIDFGNIVIPSPR